MFSLLKNPRFWPLFLLMLIVRLLCLLPYRMLMWMGAGLGNVLRAGLKSRVKVARINLGLVYPEKTAEELDRLLKASFASLGQMVFEAGLAWWGSHRRIARLSQIEGAHHLTDLLEQDQGVLLVSAHFTTLEIGTRILCQTIPGKIAGLYRKHGSPALDQIVRESRLNYAAGLFNRSQTRQAVKHLRKGQALWYAADQDYGRGESVFVPFLGVEASTITSTHHLARMGRAKVIIVSQQRLDNGRGYLLSFSPVLDSYPSSNLTEDCLIINTLLGELVKQNPGQYMWLHRRFKTRPDGAEKIY